MNNYKLLTIKLGYVFLPTIKLAKIPICKRYKTYFKVVDYHFSNLRMKNVL